MSREALVGWGMVAAALVAVVLFGYLFFLAQPETQWLAVRVVLYLAILGVAGILGWVGYSLATTPPPKPIEEIEKEIQEELRRLEEELKRQESSGEAGSS